MLITIAISAVQEFLMERLAIALGGYLQKYGNAQFFFENQNQAPGLCFINQIYFMQTVITEVVWHEQPQYITH